MLSRYEQFSFFISTIYRSIQKIERDEMEKYGYKGAYAQYLSTISRHPEGITASRMSEICDKDKAAVSRVVSEMEEKGLVVRIGHGESMYRAKLYLTDEGRRVANFVSERAVAAVAAGGEGLSDAEREVFYRVMDRIAANLHKVGRDGIPTDDTGE